MDLIPKDKILEIAEKVATLAPVDCPVTHRFAPGIYLREMFIPAGAIVVGHYHKHEHICQLIKGRMAFIKDNDYEIIQAPATFLAQPGNKVVFAFEDSIVQNIHSNPDNLRDEDKLAEIFIEKMEISNKERMLCHGESSQVQALWLSAAL
jgi:hypothetical protein